MSPNQIYMGSLDYNSATFSYTSFTFLDAAQNLLVMCKKIHTHNMPTCSRFRQFWIFKMNSTIRNSSKFTCFVRFTHLVSLPCFVWARWLLKAGVINQLE